MQNQHPHHHDYDHEHEHADWHFHEHDAAHPHEHGGVTDYMQAVSAYRKTFASKQDVLDHTPDPAVREPFLSIQDQCYALLRQSLCDHELLWYESAAAPFPVISIISTVYSVPLIYGWII